MAAPVPLAAPSVLLAEVSVVWAWIIAAVVLVVLAAVLVAVLRGARRSGLVSPVDRGPEDDGPQAPPPAA